MLRASLICALLLAACGAEPEPPPCGEGEGEGEGEGDPFEGWTCDREPLAVSQDEAAIYLGECGPQNVGERKHATSFGGFELDAVCACCGDLCCGPPDVFTCFWNAAP